MPELAPNDFEFLASLLLKEGGMVVEPGKEYLITTRLNPVAKRHGLPSLTALVGKLRTLDLDLRADVVDAMTVNETSFFRDPRVWTEVATLLVPELLEQRRTLRRLDIWVAASSSGQEVYTLAMLLAEVLGSELVEWRIQILATDLSRAMVERTIEGRYSDHEVQRGLSAERRHRFMHKAGNGWQVNDDLRTSVKARVANLTDPKLDVRGPFDLILLRNVLIYFKPAMRHQILANQASLLNAHGRLLLGASEGAGGVPDSLVSERFGSLVTYQRADAPRTTSPRVSAATSNLMAQFPAQNQKTPDLMTGTTSPTLTTNQPATFTASTTAPASPAAPQPPTETSTGTPELLGQARIDEDGLTPLERLRALRKEYQQ